MSGVTFAMKNMYGVVDQPLTLHGGTAIPAVADLNCIPAIRDKVRFTIGDAMSSVYDGGPGFHPERLWYPNALIVGEDRVALDTVAWQMLERKRAEVGLPTFEAAGRAPLYIAVAADAAHGLGTNDPQRDHLRGDLTGALNRDSVFPFRQGNESPPHPFHSFIVKTAGPQTRITGKRRSRLRPMDAGCNPLQA